MNAPDDKEERAGKAAGDKISAANERHLTVAGNRIQSRDLFVGTREIIILHGADAYHLRLTAQNKLILTK
jgi:hemin uptake protein HemP